MLKKTLDFLINPRGLSDELSIIKPEFVFPMWLGIGTIFLTMVIGILFFFAATEKRNG